MSSSRWDWPVLLALAGYLANYEAAWQAEGIAEYYLFPGSRMRMLDDEGTRWTRRVRAGVKPMSRDGARVAFKQQEAIAKIKGAPTPNLPLLRKSRPATTVRFGPNGPHNGPQEKSAWGPLVARHF